MHFGTKLPRPRRTIALLAAVLLAGACQQNPQTAAVAVQPKTIPTKTITSFTDALQCMDELLWAHGKRDIIITSAGLPDATQKISAGTKEMLISAISRMSVRSNGYRFVDFDPMQQDIMALSGLIGIQSDFLIPNYYIRGAITQLDDNVLSSLEGASIALPFMELGVSRDQIVTLVTVDMNVVSMTSRQVLPGMSASNTIAVVRSGQGADAGGRIGKAGLSFNVSLNEAEGPAQAVRTLIELSTIEVLGKLARVPYWQCLQIDQTNPQMMQQAREWFDTMKPEERDQFVSAALRGLGYLRDGESLTNAVGRFQADSQLIATGRIDFDLYYKLLGATRKGGIDGQPLAVPASLQAGGTPPQALAAAPVAQPLIVSMSALNRGARPSYRPGESLEARVEVTADAYLYCFYQDSDGVIARVFPNRFQSDALVPANRRMIEIPPDINGAKPFQIQFQTAGVQEEIACVGSPREIGPKLPAHLKSEDLTPLPVRSLDEIVGTFRSLDATVVDARLPIAVVP